MRTDDGASQQNLLKGYGDPIASYGGRGVLELQDGQKVESRFEASQFTTGDILLLCMFSFPLESSSWPSDRLWSGPGACRFEGKTSEGSRITAHEPIILISDHFSGRFGCEPEISATAAFRLREMNVHMTEDSVRAHSARFGVTNFIFTGTERHKSGNWSHLSLPLDLKSATKGTQLSIHPVKGYNRIRRRVQTLKGIDVTCGVVGDIPEEGGIVSLKEVVDDLCYLLSVARGTKIQWIYCDQYNESGALVMRAHSSRVTKPYCPFAVIDPRGDGRDETKTFLEQAYSAYVSKRDSFRLNQGTIDAYLDAKAENDYLEMRGVKLAVALEMLKSTFLEMPDSSVKEFVLDEEEFKKLVAPISKAIEDTLELNGVNEKDSRKAICADKKIEGLNRRSFRYFIDKLCKQIGLKVEEKEIKLFVACRDKLIHKGRFYYEAATKQEREECPPLPSKTHEYFFLVHFLDRIFLKLLGYGGIYIDWSVPGEPSRREQT